MLGAVQAAGWEPAQLVFVVDGSCSVWYSEYVMATRLTPETIRRLETAIDEIREKSGWGEVSLTVRRGRVVGLVVKESQVIDNPSDDRS